MTETKEITILEKDYLNDLNKIKETIRTNQAKAMVVVNSAMIMTYYEIGTIINQRKVWGNKYIERLSNDLKEYGKGYSSRNIRFMSTFAKKFSKDEILQQPATQIPWYTLCVIIIKSNSHEEMLWYIDQTHNNGWSRSMVLNQIAMKSYERSLIEPTTTEAITASNDLKEYGKGYSRANLFEMMKFANEFNLEDIIQQPVRQIPWGSLVKIMQKSNSHEEMLWYIKETHKNGWSRIMVLNQIAMKSYERSLIEPKTTEAITISNDFPNELFKDTYVFDFLDKEKIKTEKDLKNHMIENIIKFLQELGPVFEKIFL